MSYSVPLINDLTGKDIRPMTPSGEYGIWAKFVDLIAGVDNSWWAANADCTKAAGGSSESELYRRCMAGQRQAVSIAVAANPSGAQAYEDITSGNPIDILNPFSGGLTVGEVPGWIWLGLGVAGIFLVNEVRGK